MRRPLVLALLVLLLLSSAQAGPMTTLGLIQNDPGSFAGYSLFAHLTWPETYLIDHGGLLVRSWTSAYAQGNSAYLLENGNLLRAANPGGNTTFVAGGAAGMVQEFDWDGNLLWEFLYSDTLVRHHHDVAPLPNGNVLILAWEYKSGAEALAAGRDPAFMSSGEVWPEHVVEVEPVGATGGNIVWAWYAWDHLVQDFDSTKANWGVVADHPELIDLNFGSNSTADWLHANSIDYNATLDQIVLSIPRFDEFWVIDHATTTAEAAGHTGGARGRGGDILYRWGNPRAYGAGDVGDQQLFFEHDVEWIAPGLPGAGNFLVFNNGRNRPAGEYSTIEEIVPSDANGNYPMPAPGVPHGPAAPTWTFIETPPTDFFSNFVSGSQRQPNGNTLICEGATGRFFEVQSAGTTVWTYISPVNASGPMDQGSLPIGNAVFRADRYAPDFAGFDGRDLTPGAPIEICPTAAVVAALPTGFALAQNRPNPVRSSTTFGFSLETAADVVLAVYDVRGRRVANLVSGRMGAGEHNVPWHVASLPNGVYHYELRVGTERAARTMIVVR